MKQADSILDNLISTEEDNELIFSDKIVLPRRCVMCKQSVICSVVPTFINLSKIKIYVSIEQCPFHTPIPTNDVGKAKK
jgi:hypothetical protein